MQINFSKCRAAMVDGRYQANIKCPSCGSWAQTVNLEVFKDTEGNRVADAAGVICGKTGCGEEIGDLLILEWPYSAPVKWRFQLERVFDENEVRESPPMSEGIFNASD